MLAQLLVKLGQSVQCRVQRGRLVVESAGYLSKFIAGLQLDRPLKITGFDGCYALLHYAKATGQAAVNPHGNGGSREQRKNENDGGRSGGQPLRITEFLICCIGALLPVQFNYRYRFVQHALAQRFSMQRKFGQGLTVIDPEILIKDAPGCG